MKTWTVFTPHGHRLGEVEAENSLVALETARDYHGKLVGWVKEKVPANEVRGEEG